MDRGTVRWGSLRLATLALAGVVVNLVGVAMNGIVPGSAMVRAASDPAGFTVSPAFQQMRIQVDQSRVQYELKIRNNNTADQNFRLSVVDFGALDEGGGVAFLGTPTSELEHKYGLASWMTLEKDTVFVRAGQLVSVVVTVNNRPSLAPGGHYGAVLATAVTDTGQPGVAGRVGVKQVLSSLILLSKEGGAAPDLKLIGQSSDGGWGKLPARSEQRFRNEGNVHVTPRGIAELKDPMGRVVVRGALNEGSGAVLPESIRSYKTSMVGVAKAWLPGRYALVTTYRYDGSGVTKSVTTHVWYAGLVVVWLVALGVLVVVVGLAWWLWVRPRRSRRAAAR